MKGTEQSLQPGPRSRTINADHKHSSKVGQRSALTPNLPVFESWRIEGSIVADTPTNEDLFATLDDREGVEADADFDIISAIIYFT